MSNFGAGVVSRLAGQSGLVMLGNLFTLLVGFPFQVYLANKLGAHQLGVFGIFEVLAQTAGAVFSLGLGFTLIRYLPQHVGQGWHRHARNLLSAAFAVTACAGIVAAVMVATGRPLLLAWMPELGPYADLFILAAIMTWMGMMIWLSQHALRAFFDVRRMIAMSSFLQLLVKVLITIVLLWLGWELMGYMVAVVVSAAVALTGMLLGIRAHVKRLERSTEAISRETETSWLAYSRTMYGTYLLGVMSPPVERFLLAGVIDLASVGVLMAVRQLQMFLQVPLTIIATGVSTLLVAAKTRNDHEEVRQLYHTATDWGCRLGFPLLLFLLFFGGEILAIYGPAFARDGQLPLALLVGGLVLGLMVGPVDTMLNMLGHERTLFRFSVVSNVIALGCLLVLVPFLGLVGAVIGTTLSMLYMNLAALRTIKKELGIPWWSARYARLVMPIGVLAGVLVMVKLAGVLASAWLLAAFLPLSYGIFFGIYLCAGLTNEDREILALLQGKIMAPMRRASSGV